MIKFIEKIISLGKLTPLYDLFGKRSYSQSGEDVVVDAILDRKKSGYYIDIGAYHPKVFSNTYMFYKRGWSGVCVDANPGLGWMYRLVRPRDVFVEAGVCHSELDSESRKSWMPDRVRHDRKVARRRVNTLEYFVFDEEAANTFSVKQKEENVKAGRTLIKTILVPMVEVNTVLEKYVTKKQKIDLLSIDIEGMDLQILKSIDWRKYRPRIIVVEDRGVEKYLEKLGYNLVGMTGYSVIFKLVD